MTPHGIATVARQEFRIRIRAGRWRWLLASWFVVLLLITALLKLSVDQVDAGDTTNKGVVVYGGLTLLVLGLALLVVPTLAAQSVNGDRERGTLATLQVTRLSAGDIAVGKLAAAWGTSLVFLGLTLPLVAYCMALGGVPLGRVAVVSLVLALLLGTVASLALCLSALLSRTTTSGVLAYLTVFGLTLGTLIAFGLGTALTQESYTATSTCPTVAELQQQGVPEPDRASILSSCSATYTATRTRTDLVWWLLAPNPFVVLADAAPQLPALTTAEKAEIATQEAKGIHRTNLRDADPLGGLGRSVRGLRSPPSPAGVLANVLVGDRHRPVWPWGLGFDVALGGGALWLTARRLRTPTRHLPRGQRVA
jgi:ABC-type transport system involved in multi-copper enzyme maturation permease subunit